MFLLLVRISWVPQEKFFMIILRSYLCIHSSLNLYVLNTRTWISLQRSRDVLGTPSGDTAASLSHIQTAFLMHPQLRFSIWWLSCIHRSDSCDLLFHSNPSLPWSCLAVLMSKYSYSLFLSFLSSCTWLCHSCYVWSVIFFLYTL